MRVEERYFLQAFAKIGLIPDGGATFLLPRLIGWGRAVELSLLVGRLPAEKAFEWGLVNRLYDDPAAQRQFAVRSGAHARTATLILDRIRCAACLWLNEQWLRQQPGLVRVDINYATHRAQVEWEERVTRLSRILEAIRAIGYDAYPFDPQRQGLVLRRANRGERESLVDPKRPSEMPNYDER